MLKAIADPKIGVLGHNGKVLEFPPQADPSPKYEHKRHPDFNFTR